jgi:hypothetical protein
VTSVSMMAALASMTEALRLRAVMSASRSL